MTLIITLLLSNTFFFENLIYFAGLSQRMSSQLPKSAFSAFERRRSTILAEKRKTQTQKSYDMIYDDADNLRPSHLDPFQPGQSNSHQFQYDNPGFKRDENI